MPARRRDPQGTEQPAAGLGVVPRMEGGRSTQHAAEERHQSCLVAIGRKNRATRKRQRKPEIENEQKVGAQRPKNNCGDSQSSVKVCSLKTVSVFCVASRPAIMDHDHHPPSYGPPMGKKKEERPAR